MNGDYLQRIAAALERIANRLDATTNSDDSCSDQLLNVEEAAKYLRVSSKKLRQIVNRSRKRIDGCNTVGPAIQFQQESAGASIRFKREWLDEYLAASTITPADGKRRQIPRRKQSELPEVELADGSHINFDYLD